MNKRDYVSALRAQLKTLPSNDVEEIAKEFEAHFDIGVSEGKTEEEIAAKLGSPEEVAQIYLSDTVPGFDVAAAANAANAPQFPIIPIKMGWVLGRGVGPQTIAGFCDPASAKPVVNSAPKKEPEGYKFAHTGAKAKEEYVNVGPQGKKQVDLPDYSMYPAQDPNRQRSEKKEHNLAFAILFTIFVFIPVWLIALAVLLLLIATPILTGVIAGVLFRQPSPVRSAWGSAWSSRRSQSSSWHTLQPRDLSSERSLISAISLRSTETARKEATHEKQNCYRNRDHGRVLRDVNGLPFHQCRILYDQRYKRTCRPHP